ncbi:KUP system potassium uptake protein [Roseiarcus fermentans]|uniref:Probable potassium transport system protein Kup n=1 Tax=Roseiarcus fermentans TaxID=1473586 RepID=A0A366F4Z2_9HYPH|nr:KUP/HAK/KT family potassium transporter [Roseiarcus fermentans]RBP09684.1 KUP system potassium uptake protein [Roseiarcus fermentans]
MSAAAGIGTIGHEGKGRSVGWASLACMGVVFGDIGTSPLYTLNTAVKAASSGGQATPEAAVGIVSLIFWSLIIVISLKYATLIMRADNHGEGGILALLALVHPRRAKPTAQRAALLAIGLVGATLLYGDGTITPAISVLSAIEGLKLYAPQMSHVVVPLTVAILAALFVIQRHGTSFVGGLFGPVMLVWFLVAGALGAAGIVREPAILAALSPVPAVTYLVSVGPLALVVIGGAFLAVTGGEAFYADMGHFGPLPIRLAWFGLALPALTLSYFGQGALLLAEPGSSEVLDNPFFALAPQWAHYPLVALAAVATVIASQAIISGAYSLTEQAINLGFLPRMTVIHTEGREIGQIYVPFVNWTLAAGTLAAVLGFGSSDALAGAYGVAVSLLMVITTVLATYVALHWKINPAIVYAVNGSLLALDLLFFAATSTKLLDGGWFPLMIAIAISFAMLTWRKGSQVLDALRVDVRERTQAFVERLRIDPPFRIPGTAVVLGRMAKGVPIALSRNVNFNRTMHQNVVLVAVEMTETPHASDHERVVAAPIGAGLTRAELRFGFMEQPDVPQGLADAMAEGKIETFDLGQAIYFTGHETILPLGKRPGMPRWREAVFAFMHRNAQRPDAYFKLPSAQVMEIGIEFEI